MKVSLLQLNLHWENSEKNRQHIGDFWQQSGIKSDIVVLPEMFTTGFTMNVVACAEKMEGESVKWMRFFSSEEDCLLIGSLIIEENGQYYNRLLAVDRGLVVGQYDKKHLFRMAKEQETFSAGTEKIVIEYKGWKICPLICYDLRFPVWARNRRENQQAEYDLLIYVANWPERRVGHWEKLLLARAIENQCFVLGVNRVGEDGNSIPYSGSSAIVDFLGNSMPQYEKGIETILFAELSKFDLEEYRTKFPAWQDADEFSLM